MMMRSGARRMQKERDERQKWADWQTERGSKGEGKLERGERERERGESE